MFIYLTTNLVNNMKYVGKHETKDINDGYLGSGILINRAIKKYGKHNFKREILEICIDKQQLVESEIKWILHYNAVDSKEFYNIAFGGQGGNTNCYNEEWKKNISIAVKNTWNNYSEEDKEKRHKTISDGIQKKIINGTYINSMQGKKHSEETKKKIGEKSINRNWYKGPKKWTAEKNKERSKKVLIEDENGITIYSSLMEYLNKNSEYSFSENTLRKYARQCTDSIDKIILHSNNKNAIKYYHIKRIIYFNEISEIQTFYN